MTWLTQIVPQTFGFICLNKSRTRFTIPPDLHMRILMRFYKNIFKTVPSYIYTWLGRTRNKYLSPSEICVVPTIVCTWNKYVFLKRRLKIICLIVTTTEAQIISTPAIIQEETVSFFFRTWFLGLTWWHNFNNFLLTIVQRDISLPKRRNSSITNSRNCWYFLHEFLSNMLIENYTLQI